MSFIETVSDDTKVSSLAPKGIGGTAIKSSSTRDPLFTFQKLANGSDKKIEERAVAALERILLKMLATEDFIYKALEATPDALISYMNTWDCETMEAFVEQYDALPEPMLVKLISAGLKCDNVPKDLLLSHRFLHIAANENPKQLASILNNESIGDVRQAMKDLPSSIIKELWDNGLSTNKLPIAKISEFFSLLGAKELERFSTEITNPVNALQKTIVTQSLEGRSAQAHGPKYVPLSL